jgi:hypothetical protein
MLTTLETMFASTWCFSRSWMMTGDWVAAVFGNDHGVFLLQYLASCGLSSQLSLDIGFRGMSLVRATVLPRMTLEKVLPVA